MLSGRRIRHCGKLGTLRHAAIAVLFSGDRNQPLRGPSIHHKSAHSTPAAQPLTNMRTQLRAAEPLMAGNPTILTSGADRSSGWLLAPVRTVATPRRSSPSVGGSGRCDVRLGEAPAPTRGPRQPVCDPDGWLAWLLRRLRNRPKQPRPRRPPEHGRLNPARPRRNRNPACCRTAPCRSASH